MEQVYKTKIEYTPDRWLSMEPSGEGLFGARKQSVGFGGPPRLFYIDGKTGEETWLSKAKDLDHVEKDPDYLHVFWEANTLLILSRNFGNYQLSVRDVTTGEEKWFIEDKSASAYRSKFSYHSGLNAFLQPTPHGLRMYDIDTGEILWTRSDLKELNESSLLNSSKSWQYLPGYDHYLVFTNENYIHFIDPATGESSWEVKKNIGSLINADVFEDDGAVLFYGTEDESLVEDLLERSDGLIGALTRADDKGLIEEDVYYLDLDEGVVKWQNKFYTNGYHQVAITSDKVVVYGIALHTYDRETGEVIWQNISEERFNKESFLKLFSAATTTDLTVGERMKSEDLIIDGKVYAIYPEIFDNPLKKNTVAMVRYDLETGEEDWRTEYSKFSPDFYFGDEGKIVMLGGTGGFVNQPVVRVLNASDGSLILEDKLNTTRVGNVFVVGNMLYLHTSPPKLTVYDLVTGESKTPDLPGKPWLFRELKDGFFAIYPKGIKGKAIIALHNKQTLEVERQMEVPGYYDTFTYKGENFFLEDFYSDIKPGLIALDLEQFKVKGYLINKKEGSHTSNGQDQIYANYHLFVTDDGKYVYEFDEDQLKKYRIP
ncbi:PQQ-binding-like beta-propeller repeat protein [Flavobacteriales bacterium DA487]